jgi:hypothetical protein
MEIDYSEKSAEKLPPFVIREIKADWIVTEGPYTGWHHVFMQFDYTKPIALYDCYALRLEDCYLVIHDAGASIEIYKVSLPDELCVVACEGCDRTIEAAVKQFEEGNVCCTCFDRIDPDGCKFGHLCEKQT